MKVVAGETTRLLSEIGSGNGKAADELLPLVYQELRALAQSHLRHERADHTLQATALVHEAYLRLVNSQSVAPRDRTHFFALAAQAIRRILVDHARRHARQKRGGGCARLSLEDVPAPMMPDVDLLALDEALDKLARGNPQSARIVEMHFFAGSTFEEIAEMLSVSLSTVRREWRVARAWLHRELTDDDGSTGEIRDG